MRIKVNKKVKTSGVTGPTMPNINTWPSKIEIIREAPSVSSWKKEQILQPFKLTTLDKQTSKFV